MPVNLDVRAAQTGNSSMMKNIAIVTLMLVTLASAANASAEPASGQITIRTESFPRPPYSGATYYIYEQRGEIICTKLEVCNKYDECSTEYIRGRYKSEVDAATGEPYGSTTPVIIPVAKLGKHVCLVRHRLVPAG